MTVAADVDPIANSGAGAPVDFFAVCLGAFGSDLGALDLGLGLGLDLGWGWGWGGRGALFARVLLRGVDSLGIGHAFTGGLNVVRGSGCHGSSCARLG